MKYLKKRTIQENVIKQVKPIGQFRMEEFSITIKFSPHHPQTLLTADEIGVATILNVAGLNQDKGSGIQQIKPKKQYLCHARSIFDADWIDQSTKFVTCSGDLSCGLWDVETGKNIVTGIGHKGSVRVIKSSPFSNNIFVSGGRDGRLIIWDIRCRNSNVLCKTNLSSFVISPDKNEGSGSFTGLTFYGDSQTLLTVQANNSSINAFDLRGSSKGSSFSFNDQTYLESKINQNISQIEFEQLKETMVNRPRGYCGLNISNCQTKISVNSLDGTCWIYEISKLDFLPPIRLTGSRYSFYSKCVFSPNNQFLATGTLDSKIRIWNYKRSQSYDFEIHNWGEVSGIDWANSNFSYLASIGDDKNLFIWDSNGTDSDFD